MRRKAIIAAAVAMVMSGISGVLLFHAVKAQKLKASPKWAARKHVEPSDYDTMKKLFVQDPLPPSFMITAVDYVGFSRFFNGPDGPAESKYRLTLSGTDYDRLTSHIVCFRETGSIYPRFDAAVYGLMSSAEEEAWHKYWWNKNPQGQSGDYPIRFAVKTHFGSRAEVSWVVVDDRSSPSLTMYVSTRLPYL